MTSPTTSHLPPQVLLRINTPLSFEISRAQALKIPAILTFVNNTTGLHTLALVPCFAFTPEIHTLNNEKGTRLTERQIIIISDNLRDSGNFLTLLANATNNLSEESEVDFQTHIDQTCGSQSLCGACNQRERSQLELCGFLNQRIISLKSKTPTNQETIDELASVSSLYKLIKASLLSRAAFRQRRGVLPERTMKTPLVSAKRKTFKPINPAELVFPGQLPTTPEKEPSSTRLHLSKNPRSLFPVE